MKNIFDQLAVYFTPKTKKDDFTIMKENLEKIRTQKAQLDIKYPDCEANDANGIGQIRSDMAQMILVLEGVVTKYENDKAAYDNRVIERNNKTKEISDKIINLENAKEKMDGYINELKISLASIGPAFQISEFANFIKTTTKMKNAENTADTAIETPIGGESEVSNETIAGKSIEVANEHGDDFHATPEHLHH